MAWHKTLALGLLTSAVAIGCTVTTSDDTDGGITGDGGSTGGAANTGGAASTGGAGTGGAGTGGAPATYTCSPSTQTDNCQKCIDTSCCSLFQACYLADGCVETLAYHDCMVTKQGTAGSLTPQDSYDCSLSTATSGTPLIETQDMIACLTGAADAGQNCAIDCYNQTF